MKKKFNIALTPLDQNNCIIKLARAFANIADTYLLGEHSFPHVTLCHFFWEETQINELWQIFLDKYKPGILELKFDTFNYDSFNQKGIFWISLMPDKRDVLQQLHETMACLVEPVNKSFQNYDPHLTLLNTKKGNCEEMLADLQKELPIKYQFVLSLGYCDNSGQITDIIYSAK